MAQCRHESFFSASSRALGRGRDSLCASGQLMANGSMCCKPGMCLRQLEKGNTHAREPWNGALDWRHQGQ